MKKLLKYFVVKSTLEYYIIYLYRHIYVVYDCNMRYEYVILPLEITIDHNFIDIMWL
jgi:hypothetical protein